MRNLNPKQAYITLTGVHPFDPKGDKSDAEIVATIAQGLYDGARQSRTLIPQLLSNTLHSEEPVVSESNDRHERFPGAAVGFKSVDSTDGAGGSESLLAQGPDSLGNTTG